MEIWEIDKKQLTVFCGWKLQIYRRLAAVPIRNIQRSNRGDLTTAHSSWFECRYTRVITDCYLIRELSQTLSIKVLRQHTREMLFD